MSRFVTFFAVVLLLAGLAGCNLVSSVHPLSDATTSIDDDRLVGEWIPVDPKTRTPSNEERIMSIRKAAQGHAYEVISANKEEQTTLFTAAIGDRHYFSAPLKSEPVVTRYVIVQYELRGDELQMFFLDSGKTADAVDKGLIEGTVTRDKPSPDNPKAKGSLKEVVLTASSDQLRKFLDSKAGQAVIYTDEPTLVLKRAPK
jgi:hypothetical protein